MAVVGNVTGDAKNFVAVEKEGVVLHNMPVIATASLEDKSHVINQFAISGKRVGALITHVVGGKPVLMQAAGDSDVSAWIAVTKGGADVTPS